MSFSRNNIALYLIAGLCLIPHVGRSETLMKTHGWITIEKYVHGLENTDYDRSHRSEFTGIIDLFRVRQFTATVLIGNTLDVLQHEKKNYYLNRIIYTYTWGGRLDFKRMVVKMDYHHDCIHLINQAEINGSTWWNALQVKVGSRGSFYLYVPADYKKEKDGLIGDLDARIGISAYRQPTGSIADGSNHNYRFEFTNLTRLHIGKFDRWILFADQTSRYWLTWDGDGEYKAELTLNFMYRGRKQYAGFFYEYHFHDTYTMDQEGPSGSLGFRILF